MADMIRATPEKLRQTAEVFSQKGEEVSRLTQEMTSTVLGLSGRIWSGEAASAYAGKFLGMQKDIARLYQMIRTHAGHLAQIAAEYETAEETSRQEAAALTSELNF